MTAPTAFLSQGWCAHASAERHADAGEYHAFHLGRHRCCADAGHRFDRAARAKARRPDRRALDGAARQGRSRGASGRSRRSEEHTSELQSLMRISYAFSSLKKKKPTNIM